MATNKKTLALTIFLLLFFGLGLNYYLTFFHRTLHTGSSLLFSYSFFLIFLPILFFILLIRRSHLTANKTESQKIATYLALSTLLLILFFLRTNTILLDKIPFFFHY